MENTKLEKEIKVREGKIVRIKSLMKQCDVYNINAENNLKHVGRFLNFSNWLLAFTWGIILFNLGLVLIVGIDPFLYPLYYPLYFGLWLIPLFFNIVALVIVSFGIKKSKRISKDWRLLLNKIQNETKKLK